MINYFQFQKIVIEKLGRDISVDENLNQYHAINAPINESQFIVAGPGSGKTTVMVLKILKFIFVDDVKPHSILATTFTRKAAAELRSRILSWGDQIKQTLITDKKYDNIHSNLKFLDFNQIITGTLDSISEEILRTNREPGAAQPEVIEQFVANAFMLRVSLFEKGKHHNDELIEYLKEIRGTAWGLNVAEMSRTLLEIKDRLYYDQIIWNDLKKNLNHPGENIALQSVEDYVKYLDQNLLLDFSRLEAEFLDKLKENKFEKFTKNIKIILVDEYQDTNLLQEQIYFQLGKTAQNNGGSLTMVGDDDQSLYRFRGATIDLFTQYKDRVREQLKFVPVLIHLSNNYRSTDNIIKFINSFIGLDQCFQSARVKHKPTIKPARKGNYTNFPVLGMFRPNIETLSRDLAQFINEILYHDGYRFQYLGESYNIKANPLEGSPTDIAVLMSSPLELSSSKKSRLPKLLRIELNNVNPPIPVYNIRGQNLERTWQVSTLCGLILECMDPESLIQDSIDNFPKEAKQTFNKWRIEAQKYMESDPEPYEPLSLKGFIESWQRRKPIGRKKWIREVPIIELTYKLVNWIPDMQDDVEGLMYLEAVTRTVAQTALFNNFGGDIIYDEDNTELNYQSIKEALWNIFVPLATGAVEVDEALLETLPDNRINIMSIHQAKGLEFPLVIVDVGSDFKQNYTTQEFKRFPKNGGKPCNMEDTLRTCSPLDKPTRTSRDRAFDDITRQYFVAYSRPQDVLLLVGLNSVKNGYETNQGSREIANVATGWSRDGKWYWPKLDNIKQI